jgi:hypothetical protein
VIAIALGSAAPRRIGSVAIFRSSPVFNVSPHGHVSGRQITPKVVEYGIGR